MNLQQEQKNVSQQEKVQEGRKKTIHTISETRLQQVNFHCKLAGDGFPVQQDSVLVLVARLPACLHACLLLLFSLQLLGASQCHLQAQVCLHAALLFAAECDQAIPVLDGAAGVVATWEYLQILLGLVLVPVLVSRLGLFQVLQQEGLVRVQIIAGQQASNVVDGNECTLVRGTVASLLGHVGLQHWIVQTLGHLCHLLLHRVLHDEAVHIRPLRLADAIDAANGLLLNSRIEHRLNQHNVCRFHDVEAHVSFGQRHQQDTKRFAGLELKQRIGSLSTLLSGIGSLGGLEWLGYFHHLLLGVACLLSTLPSLCRSILHLSSLSSFSGFSCLPRFSWLALVLH
eukprot:m.301365 g.301365  ORF g.301365 m.301365 type:complete len:342 (-) comp22994_c1_seq7:5357-6382(-)